MCVCKMLNRQQILVSAAGIVVLFHATVHLQQLRDLCIHIFISFRSIECMRFLCVCAVAVLPSTYTSPTTKHLLVMLVFHPPNRRYAFDPHMPNYTKSKGTSPTNKIMARHLKHAL